MSAIETHGLTKQYDTTPAVTALDLSVRPGEIYGFLGPNGAGKSTTIAMMLDFVRPTGGRAAVLGYDTRTEPVAIRQRVGVVTDNHGLAGRHTASGHVSFALRAHGLPDRPAPWLHRVGLSDDAHRHVREFSTGMRQRLRLALAIIGEPELLLLDEPANGLDPAGQRWLRELIFAERDRGTTVFVSSHRLEQVEMCCDRVGIIVDGRLRAEGTPAELVEDGAPTVIVDVPTWTARDAAAIRHIDGVASVREVNATGDRRRLTIALADSTARERVLDELPDGSEVRTSADGPLGLEQAYARLTTEGACHD